MIKDIVAATNKLHDEGKITDAQLIAMLEECVNATALENGYVDQHGLPFPSSERKRAR